jgi:hypothetical protein
VNWDEDPQKSKFRVDHAAKSHTLSLEIGPVSPGLGNSVIFEKSDGCETFRSDCRGQEEKPICYRQDSRVQSYELDRNLL